MKKNGFISKQLQKMIAPIIYEFMQTTHEICLDLINTESYDDLLKLFDEVRNYDDYEKLVLKKLKEKGYDING